MLRQVLDLKFREHRFAWYQPTAGIEAMALRIEQGFEYQNEDWWKWWIWIDGPEEELDEVDHVIYILHPTFPTPVRTVKDRPTKFLLQTAGWGVFRIHAKVISKNG